MPSSLSSNATCSAFIGYSEFAHNKGQTLRFMAQLVSSLDDFEQYFGGPAPVSITMQLDEHNNLEHYSIRKNFLLYDSVKLFFLNGGESCYIISVGGYDQSVKVGNNEQGLLAGLAALESCPKAKLLLIPDAVSVSETANENESFQALQQAAIAFCTEQDKLFALLDQQEDSTNPKHNQRINNGQFIERTDEPSPTHGTIYSPWIKTTFSTPLELRDIKLERTGKTISFNAIDSSPEVAELLDELEETIDNANRIAKSIKRRQRGEASLTHRYQTLLANYLAQPIPGGDNLPLHFLLLFLKGLAEMINNWICACTLDEVLAGDMIDIIRQTIIPEIATKGLPDLIEFHQQAIETGIVDAPVTGYNEMFCLSSCIGSNCPWQKSTASTESITIRRNPAENEQSLTTVFDHFEEAISVVVELAEQFERNAQEKLLNQSPALRQLFTTLQHSRHVPPSGVIAGIVSHTKETELPERLALNCIDGICD